MEVIVGIVVIGLINLYAVYLLFRLNKLFSELCSVVTELAGMYKAISTRILGSVPYKDIQ